ncbi:MAG: hypothetical protein F4069_06960 [Rhodothermaceae bacterium]|nr:hypothetical protein [Rhodothermaceae bacterium]MYG70133.1 hypothetical protein [Rhodothermaceae bacterium]MYJ45051.1 hypothetical protein [Rhodothermaceae bacterium]
MWWSRLLPALLLTGCNTASYQSQVLDSPVVPFEELFDLADTIRLDPSIIIGQISFLDVNQEGSFLVADLVGRSVHLFSSSGEHIRPYPVPECLPDDAENYSPFSSRFLGNDYVVVMAFNGAVSVFSTDGRCIEATRRISKPSFGFCTSNDSILFLGPPWPVRNSVEEPAIIIYSPELHKLGEVPVKWPEFPVLNMGRGGIVGRNIDCFSDGPFYIYLGSMDAIPVRSSGNILRQRPEFYEQRPRDLSPDMSLDAKREEWNNYITTDGIFALDGHTRMLVYRNIDDRWLPEGAEDLYLYRGVSIASNKGEFSSLSTISSFVPLAAGYGYLYGQADPELLPDGDIGNPLILRYRFIRPKF